MYIPSSQSEVLASILGVLLASALGAVIPRCAHHLMQQTRQRYQEVLKEILSAYCSFWENFQHFPRKKLWGAERTLYTWMQEIPRLSEQGALSRSELAYIQTLKVPLPFSITSKMLQAAPSDEAIHEEFSLENRRLYCLVSAVLTGISAAVLIIGQSGAISICAAVVCIASLVLMALIDVRTRTIPTLCTLAIVFSGVFWKLSLPSPDLLLSVLCSAGMLVLLVGANAISKALRGSDGIGNGDMRTLPLLIFVLGPDASSLGLFVAAIVLLIYLVVCACRHSLHFQASIPFGPCIAVIGITGVLWASIPCT